MKRVALFIPVFLIPVSGHCGWIEETLCTGLSGATGLSVADLDCDGDPDCAASGWNSGVVWIENGQGVYSTHQIDPDFIGAIFVDTGDLNNDGFTDVVASSNSSGTILLWENSGSGSFTVNQITDSFPGAHSVYIADIDSDGLADITGASFQTNTIACWLNNGDGTFQETLIDGDIPGIWTAYPLDIDGDGDTDIAGAARTADEVCWWENTGSAFNRHTIDAALDGAHIVIDCDIDKDGDKDLLASGRLEDEIRLYTNDGTENFSVSTVLDNCDWPTFMDTADFDLDGDMDIACVSYNDNEIIWLENTGAAFEKQIIASDYHGAIPLAVHDMNQDGREDVLSASYYLNMVSVWLNDLQSSAGGDPPLSLSRVDAEINPSAGIVRVSVAAPEGSGGSLMLFDICGRQVEERRELLFLQGQNSVTFSDVPPGVYMVVLTAEDGRSGIRVTVL